MQDVMRLKNKYTKVSARIRKVVITQASPFHKIETELYKDFLSRRNSSQKVSATWICIIGKKIYETLKRSNPEKWEVIKFTGSYGYIRRFINRKKIKFRKSKCRKYKNSPRKHPCV